MPSWKKVGLVMWLFIFCIGNVVIAQEDDVNQYIQQLQNKDIDIRKKAIQALGEIGDPRAVEPLIRAFKDWQIRTEAAEALGKIGEPAVESLLVALEEKDIDIRRAAILTLREIGDPRAVNPLLIALGDEDDGVRMGAMLALRKIGDPRVEPLLEILKDKDIDIQTAAKRAFEETGEPAIKSLLTALEDKKARQYTEKLMSEPLLMACQGKPSGSSVASGVSKNHLAKLQSEVKEVILPHHLEAKTLEDFYYAVCLTRKVQSLSSCKFYDALGKMMGEIIPQQVYWSIQVIEVRTGRTIDSTVIRGNKPVCPENAFFTQEGQTRYDIGEEPSHSNAVDWITNVLEKVASKEAK